MKITFIKPNIGRMEHSLYVDQGRMEPLMLAVLSPDRSITAVSIPSRPSKSLPTVARL